MQKKGIEYFLSKISQGILLSLAVLAVLFAYNKDSILGQLCLYEVMPAYEIDHSMKMLFKFSPNEDGPIELYASEADSTDEVEPVFHVSQIETTDIESEDDIIGVEDVIFQPETDYSEIYNHFGKEDFTIENVQELRDITKLKNKFYVVDKRTDITSDLFNVDQFLSADLSIDNSVDGPKVLIFHTHSNEKYADSVGNHEGVVGVGDLLAKTLTEEYGIETIHNKDSFDMVDGKSHVLGAYERMEPAIKKILAENPSIQVVIDLHRDGVSDTTHLVEQVNGKPTAQIMFFNGLSRLYKDGTLQEINSLPNPNLKTNLAFSFHMQLAANSLYPGFTRKVYLNAYRYSLHMLPKSLLIEVGAQTNTEEEARNAVEPLAEILAHTILK